MDSTLNIESVYRKRCKTNSLWKENDLVKIIFPLISSCFYLQKKGICHRDIQPAKFFFMQNGEVKLIDFGESKDYFYDPNDESRETYTCAAVRNTYHLYCGRHTRWMEIHAMYSIISISLMFLVQG
jgi:serine/threonine protein kinase